MEKIEEVAEEIEEEIDKDIDEGIGGELGEETDERTFRTVRENLQRTVILKPITANRKKLNMKNQPLSLNDNENDDF